MKNFFSALFLTIVLFILTMVIFQGLGLLIFVAVTIAGLVTVILNQDERIVIMEKKLGLREEEIKEEIKEVINNEPKRMEISDDSNIKE